MEYWRKPLDSDEQSIPHGELVIIVDRCKGCVFCVEYCPKSVLVMGDGYNKKGYHFPEVVENGHGEKGACVNCNLCEMMCPEFAIFSKALPNGKLGEVAVTEGASP